MLLSSLLLTPILGVLAILINKDNGVSLRNIKLIALITSIFNFFISLIIFILFDFSTNQFQFVQEYHEISYFDFYLGVDGLSIYFILLTTIIIPISLVSNWKSITKDVESYVIIILLLETLLLAVFLVLDILLFYIFFESILPPLFILIGVFGSDNRVKASFYLFLYTLLGSLFLLLSILAMSSIMSTTDFDTLFKGNFLYITQLFLFYGIFIAFAVKTPTIFLNTWLLKAHVESPLGGSIILAAIVLKLSLYGILRLILPILPKAYMEYTYIIFLIGVITIVYASLSTLRTIDIKELIAYSSVSHAAVYLLGVFSNSIQGIEGAINLGLAHGLVSPGLFICAGGVLYDRSSTRVISFYRGVTQVMPLFAILFFILCLANCGAPLSLNFIGEFLSLYGVFERSSLFGVFASSSIVFSAAYTIYMYQRIAFGGAYSKMFTFSIPDLTKREFTILLILVIPTVFFGIYPAPILDAIHYSVSTLIYCFDLNIISCDASRAWGFYFQDSASPQMEALVELHANIIYNLVAILFAVWWIQPTIRNFDSSKSPISTKYYKATLIDHIWTISPALILVLFAFPFFKLLYLMDEVTDPSLSVLAEGYQWCWSYEYPDFLSSDGDFIEFDSYLVPESDLEHGALRMLKDGPLRVLEVYNRVILPEIQKILCVFEPIKCCSSSSVAEAFKGLDVKIESRISTLTSIVERTALNHVKLDDYTSIHSKLTELKSNIASMNDISFLNAETSINHDLDKLMSKGKIASSIYDSEYCTLYDCFAGLSTEPGLESIDLVMYKVSELSEVTEPKPNASLLESDPIKFWTDKIKYTNRVHNYNRHAFNLFKESVKDNNSMFSEKDKTTLFTAIKKLQSTSAKIASTDTLICNENINSSRILAELKALKNK